MISLRSLRKRIVTSAADIYEPVDLRVRRKAGGRARTHMDRYPTAAADSLKSDRLLVNQWRRGRVQSG